ncbi:MAG TPA: cytochrome c [Hyphomicrobiaceae bacterium]|nr:cytochrome c [Hyphomicrobiaceae bacterium]
MGGKARSSWSDGALFTRVLGTALPLIAFVVTGNPTPSLAEGIDLARGERIAAERCAKCHAVGPAGESPQTGVPPFRMLAQDFPIPMLEKTLRTGIVDGHEEMPMFELGFIDVRNLLAYIDSLDPSGPAYVLRK